MVFENKQVVLAVIPARGGSKGIAKKNIRPISGKPLIAYSIDAAKSSKLLDRTVISTDDPEIAAVSKEYGAEVPFLRPLEMATDEISIYPALIHAMLWLEEQEGWQADYVVLLQPTSPLRTGEDIDNAIELAFDKDADSVISLSETKTHPYWTKTITPEGKITDFLQLSDPIYRRQDLPPNYALNGSIYMAKRAVLLENQSFVTDHTFGYIMPQERSIDVDNNWDLKLVDLILSEGKAFERD